jgi:hypothetical protein
MDTFFTDTQEQRDAIDDALCCGLLVAAWHSGSLTAQDVMHHRISLGYALRKHYLFLVEGEYVLTLWGLNCIARLYGDVLESVL